MTGMTASLPFCHRLDPAVKDTSIS